jgi:purine-binding chemotaxis protein CheW
MAAGNSNTYILFVLAGTTYAVHSSFVQQIEMVEQITPVPNAPHFVEGVIFSRGKVIPVINLRRRFGFEKIPLDVSTRLIVINSESRILGLIVDAAREFVTIEPGAIRPPHEAIDTFSGEYIEGIAMLGERIVLILGLAEVLQSTTELQVAAGDQASATSQLEARDRPGLKA